MAIIQLQGLATAPINSTEAFDEGDYIVTILKAEETTSHEKGTPGLKFDFRIDAGLAQVATGIVPVGRHIFWTMWIPLSGKGRDINLSRLAKLLKAVGVPQSDELDLEAFVGRQVQVHNKPRPYNDELQNDISNFKAVVTG